MSFSDISSFLDYFGLTPHSLAPLVLVGIILYFFISKTINKVSDRVSDIEQCIIEIQTTLRTKYKMQFQQNITSKYGVAHSPIVLRNEYRDYILKTKLDKQIKSREKELLEWLKEQKPKTGLDAQDDIGELVSSDVIAKYLDLTEYKQNLYKKGKTSEDAIGILAVYLYEILIPKLQLPDGK